MKTTQRAIAEAAGVDQSTVSLSLRNHPSIPEPTRRRIRKLATAMGYRMDPTAAIISTARWKGRMREYQNIAFVIDSKSGSEINPIDLRYFAAARAQAEKSGYGMQLFDLADYRDALSASRTLRHRGVRGLIIAPFRREWSDRSHRLEWENFSAVACGLGNNRPPGLLLIAVDPFWKVQMVMSHLIQAGCRRVGILDMPNAERSDGYLLRRAAMRSTALQYGLLPEAVPMALCIDHMSADGVAEYIASHRLDGLVIPSEAYLEPLAKVGIMPGGRFPIAGVSVMDPASPLAGTIVQEDDTAATAVSVLLGEIQHFKQGLPAVQRTILLRPKWKDAMSLRMRDQRDESTRPGGRVDTGGSYS